ncbi:hypothetical protein AM499_17410 [Bacillus sp. FJAT-22090]|uniref:hypothetical protein n=1 Tax=Bacillus sp. FJAT-22090 TaxID=1581038 RepID=UPI0006AE9F67|nr:hypothetical protein [Bacillus sp. FJAT-22090]ALC87393.1 hypothetical protein AM499_17410 [Bacillus sp. FJAT-22090]
MNRVKRLPPTKEVLRELYLKSGNQCAFPGCSKTILNNKGNVVGQICHIEAAMPGGERFNAKQSNEERRAFSNLILLCYDHHIETNEVKQFSVERLKKMKADHEKKFSDAAEKLYSTVSDKTLQQDFEYCTSLTNMNNVLKWGLSREEHILDVPKFNKLVDILRKLSPNTRAIFSIMVDRSVNSLINLEEISQVTGLEHVELKKSISLLINYELITEVDSDDYNNPITYLKQKDLWDIWSEIKNYSEKSSITLEEIINNMNFSLLD